MNVMNILGIDYCTAALFKQN